MQSSDAVKAACCSYRFIERPVRRCMYRPAGTKGAVEFVDKPVDGVVDVDRELLREGIFV